MMNLDMDYTLEFMKELLAIPSVGGDCEAAMERIRREFASLHIPVKTTKKGAVFGTLTGEDNQDQVLVNAHIDTLGAMVKEILPNGRLRVAQIGGYTWTTYEGENLVVRTLDGTEYTGTLLYEKPSVHNFPEEARHEVRTEDNMEIRLDEDFCSAQDVADAGICVGDYVFYDPRTVITPKGFIKSRYIDDKACVAVMFAVIKYLTENGIRPRHTTHFYVANYEEIGHGVSYIPENTKEMLSIDIGTAGIGHTSDEHSVTICAKDSRTPYDYGFRKRLTELARQAGIEYRVEVHNRYGSDASLCVVRGADVNFACIGPGTDASHHYERTHVDALRNTAELLKEYLIRSTG
ncbi:M42 family metallopeptidase [Diplocloster agilis]|uniref:M42 family metallopeptidase n=1 Tax=Diplocloster agilis TaxID=2850323 RepID=A0A949JWX4_9FIRM|nr:M42 family metallopeptidase [Diplocloster agilis]MBU9735594.1 M42 family metallopeptidase [Diplocloster agilis]